MKVALVLTLAVLQAHASPFGFSIGGGTGRISGLVRKVSGTAAGASEGLGAGGLGGISGAVAGLAENGIGMGLGAAGAGFGANILTSAGSKINDAMTATGAKIASITEEIARRLSSEGIAAGPGQIEDLVQGIIGGASQGEYLGGAEELEQKITEAISGIRGVDGDFVGDIKAKVNSIVDGKRNAFGKAASSVRGALSGMKETISNEAGGIEEIKGILGSDIKGSISSIRDRKRNMIEKATSGIKSAVGEVQEDFSGANESDVVGDVKAKFDSILEKKKGAFGKATGGVKGAVGGISGSISEKVNGIRGTKSEIVGDVKERVSGMIENKKEMIRGATTAIKDSVDGMKERLSGALNNIRGSTEEQINEIVEDFKGKINKETIISEANKAAEKMNEIIDDIHSNANDAIESAQKDAAEKIEKVVKDIAAPTSVDALVKNLIETVPDFPKIIAAAQTAKAEHLGEEGRVALLDEEFKPIMGRMVEKYGGMEQVIALMKSNPEQIIADIKTNVVEVIPKPEKVVEEAVKAVSPVDALVKNLIETVPDFPKIIAAAQTAKAEHLGEEGRVALLDEEFQPIMGRMVEKYGGMDQVIALMKSNPDQIIADIKTNVAEVIPKPEKVVEEITSPADAMVKLLMSRVPGFETTYVAYIQEIKAGLLGQEGRIPLEADQFEYIFQNLVTNYGGLDEVIFAMNNDVEGVRAQMKQYASEVIPH